MKDCLEFLSYDFTEYYHQLHKKVKHNDSQQLIELYEANTEYKRHAIDHL